MENIDILKEKLQKLMSKAESAKQIGNLEEASAFASKVNELLLKYNLSQKEITDFEKEPDVEGLDGGMEVRKSHGDWMAHLLNILCEYNYCKSIFTSTRSAKEYRTTIIGTHENVNAVSYLYDVLKERFQHIAKKQFSENLKTWQKANTYPTGPMIASNRYGSDIKELKDGMCTIKKPWKYIKSFPSRAKFFKSFFIGANVGLREKMNADKISAQQSEIADKINALVKVNTSAIEKYMTKHHSNVKTSTKSTRNIDYAAYQSGIAAGKGTSVSKGLSGTSAPNHKQLN